MLISPRKMNTNMGGADVVQGRRQAIVVDIFQNLLKQQQGFPVPIRLIVSRKYENRFISTKLLYRVENEELCVPF